MCNVRERKIQRLCARSREETLRKEKLIREQRFLEKRKKD